MRLATLLLVLPFAVACGILPSSPPEWVANRPPLPSCGEVALSAGLQEDDSGWRCLLTAAEGGADAELIQHLTTMEGDPLMQIIRVHEDGRIELMVDATRDQFGSGRWQLFECDRLLPDGGWDGCFEVDAP